MKYFFYLICTLLMLSGAQAQKSKGQKYYEKAMEAFKERSYEEGMNLLLKSIQKDPEFTLAHYHLGTNYKMLGYEKEMQEHYQMVFKLEPKNQQYKNAFLDLAVHHFNNGNYEEAQKVLQSLSRFSYDSNQNNTINRLSKSIPFAKAALQNPLDFQPEKLQGAINRADYLQYFPVLTADLQTLIFTARKKGKNQDEDLYYSLYEEGTWSAPLPLSQVINSDYNEGTCSISADGRTLVFTSCEGRRNFGKCDLFISYKVADKWSEPINMGPEINSSAWESQPSLSSDGKTIFFISDRKGGKGGKDIWYSTLNTDKQWHPAKNLEGAVNTEGHELSPFLHANGQTLYFSSNGHTGMGGYDLYTCSLNISDSIVNLGYPINDHHDQVSLFIAPDGSKAYYSYEERKNNDYISSLLYQFDLPETIAPQQKSYVVKGKVFDKDTQEALPADIALFDLSTREKIITLSADRQAGDYLITLNKGGEYAMEISMEGYLFESISFNLSNENNNGQASIIPIPLEKIKKGAKIILHNIFFDTGKYLLKDKSKNELDELIRFMKNNPTVQGEISGHTDDIGLPENNMELSIKRAESVYNYLINNGIDKNRLVYQGYGENKPDFPNTSDENRQKNRRIEFKIL